MSKSKKKELASDKKPAARDNRPSQDDDWRDREYYMSIRTYERMVEQGKAWPFPAN